MKKLVIATTVAALSVAGCANAPPNTPGAGYGKNYTPIIDTQGVDQARYGKDLGDCRQFAGIVDADKAAMQGLIGGILIGALVGAAAGHRSNLTSYGANYGAVAGGGAGLAAAERSATNKQERILINCMAGRGYRTLDGSTVASTSYPSPYAPQATPQATYTPAAPILHNGFNAIATQASPQAAAAAQYTVATQHAGKDLIQAEKFAAQQSCSTNLTPWPAGMGPGFETYSAACGNGSTMIIRCEYGNCRALK